MLYSDEVEPVPTFVPSLLCCSFPLRVLCASASLRLCVNFARLVIRASFVLWHSSFVICHYPDPCTSVVKQFPDPPLPSPTALFPPFPLRSLPFAQSHAAPACLRPGTPPRLQCPPAAQSAAAPSSPSPGQLSPHRATSFPFVEPPSSRGKCN